MHKRQMQDRYHDLETSAETVLRDMRRDYALETCAETVLRDMRREHAL
jgi:hypothetical protein